MKSAKFKSFTEQDQGLKKINHELDHFDELVSKIHEQKELFEAEQNLKKM